MNPRLRRTCILVGLVMTLANLFLVVNSLLHAARQNDREQALSSNYSGTSEVPADAAAKLQGNPLALKAVDAYNTLYKLSVKDRAAHDALLREADFQLVKLVGALVLNVLFSLFFVYLVLFKFQRD